MKLALLILAGALSAAGQQPQYPFEHGAYPFKNGGYGCVKGKSCNLTDQRVPDWSDPNVRCFGFGANNKAYRCAPDGSPIIPKPQPKSEIRTPQPICPEGQICDTKLGKWKFAKPDLSKDTLTASSEQVFGAGEPPLTVQFCLHANTGESVPCPQPLAQPCTCPKRCGRGGR